MLSVIFALEIGEEGLLRETNYFTCTERPLKHVLIEKHVSVIIIIIYNQIGIDC